MQKIVVVIPSYNEDRAIAGVISKAKSFVNDVIVADDNSQDDTIYEANTHGACVVCNKTGKRGVGQNTWRGMKYALNSKYCGDVIVTLDGDGQHDASHIMRVAQPIIDGKADFVIGSRLTNYKEIPLYRRFGISLITYLYNIGNSVKVGDSQSGFRAYSRKVLESIKITELGFGFSIETLVKIRAKGFRIVEVPITPFYHKDYSRNSTANPLKHGLEMVWKVIYWRGKLELLKSY